MSQEQLKDFGKHSETELLIIKTILNKPRTKEDIANILGISIKTVRNLLPKISKNIRNYTVLQNSDPKTKYELFSVVPTKIWLPDLKPKIYTYFRCPTTPYMIVNLPNPPIDNEWVLDPIGDIHFGSNSCDYSAFEECIRKVKKTPNNLVVLTGDLTENANKDSIADGVYRQIYPPQVQQEKITYKLVPIADKIILNVLGNHGNRTVNSVYLDPERNICNSLEVESFDGMMFLDIVCQSHKWEIVIAHCKIGSATLGGRINAMSKKSIYHSADIYIMAHTHDQQCVTDIELVRNPYLNKLETKKRHYIFSGGFLKYFGAYPNKEGLPPLPLGVPKIHLLCDGSKNPGKIKVEVDQIEFS